MKLFTQWRFILLSALFSLLGVGSAWAQLENGKVYCFENIGNEGKSLVITNSTNLTIATTNTDDFKQQWFVENIGGNVFTLRNLSNGKYLKSPNVTSNHDWTTVETVDDNCKFNCVEAGEGYSLRATNTNDGYHYMHYGSGTDDIVCWTITGATASHWRITEKTYEAAELEKRLDIVNSLLSTNIEKYKTALSNLFSDDACTTKKKSLTAEQLDTDEHYLVLSSTLKKMAKKVYSDANDAWTESTWDNDYAKKYRVQWYEPYTEPECAASALRINAHTNLNNPTGIFANSGDVLFVMVEGEIKEGAYLYLAKYTGHNKLGGYKDGVQLQSGLNVIPVTVDGSNYCINYVVKTFDTSKGTGKKAIIEGRELSKYPDLQIHIEGGYINGYWNKMGDNAAHNGDFNYPADTDADWNYIKERATQTDVTVLGEYVTLQFPLTDAGTIDDKGMGTFFNSYKDKTTSLEASIEEWDNVMIWERLLMGVVGEDIIAAEDKESPYSDQPKVTAYTGNDADDFGCDYSEYYRVHGLSFGTEGGYMYGGWDHCGYNFNTMESIMLSIVDEAGPHWGPAHEIGHQHQGPLNMRGLTEVTNNLFSNVVLWYFGKSTSRYNGTDGSLTNVLQQFSADGTDFFSNNIWAQTIMYYKLFLYYHVLGHNPKFYPRLFEMLRQNPMAIEYNQDGGKCLMHFYKLCCDAAGEDLTEFFRAHGFFRVMEERFVGDYSNAIYNMTQAQIDAAIAEVKTKDYPENIAVLFITDATGEGNIKSNRGDDVYLTHFDTNNSGNLISGELGNYATFNKVATPSYSYTISGNSVTMEGTGGVGFAILNEKGELIGFSDKTTFEISDETMEALSNGDAQIVVMPATGEPVEATAAMSESEIKRTLLVELIAQAEALDALTDTEGKKIGFYKSSYMTDLHNALTKAQEVVENNTVSAYTPVFNALKTAIDDLKSKEFAKITMKPGTYTVRNFAYTTRYLSVNGSNEVVTSTNAELADTEKWVFEQGDGNNVYYVKNVSTQKYVNALAQSTVVSATTSEMAKAKGWLVEDLGNGVFGLTCQDENNQAMHSAANNGYKIVGWNTGASASRWYLTALETEQLSAEQQALEELIALSEDMLERVANIETVKERVELNENSYYCNAPHKSGGDKLTTYAVLYDNDYTTFLHTDYSGTDSEDKLDHYLRVDLGEGNSASLFTFNYASRSNGNQNPTAITIEGCNTVDGTYELITKLTRDADKLISGGDSEYHSAVMGLSSKSYRYLRFTVTGTMQGSTAGPSDNTETPENEENKHVFFVFSEFGVSKATCNVTALLKYSTLTDNDVTAAFSAIREAKFAYANATQAADYTTAYNALKTYYDKLVNAYNTGDLTALTAKKEELQELINNTTALIGQCGSVVYTEETTPQLNVTAAPYMLSDNNVESEGRLEKLYDGKQGKDFSYTSNWEHALTESPYLQVDLGTGKELEELIFTFTNRTEGNAPTPTEIVVSASTDGTVFTELATFTSAEPNWPPAANNQNIAATKWTSPVIEATSACRYWRFTVTKSQRSSGGETNNKGIYHFGISEFGIVIPAGCKVTVNEGMGDVTEELLLATYDENQEAQSAHTYATTEAQVIEAIADLQAQYDALAEAKANVYRQELRAKIDELAELIAQCGEVAYDAATDTYTATVDPNAGSVTEKLLIDAAKAKAAAEEVANTSTDQAALIAEKEKLTPHCDALQAAFATKLYPVTITTDVANPVLYTMKSRRGDTKAVQYLPADGHKFNISNVSDGSAVQAYYFTEGTVRGQVYVHPYAARGMVLAANDTGDGADKAFATEKGSAQHDQWKFVEATLNEVTWYSLQPVGTSTYFSNFGGGSNKMGFYSTADEGSHLQFVSTTVEGSVAYNTLKSYYDGLPGTIEGRDNKVGYYPVTKAAAYNQVYDQATMVLNYGGTPMEGKIISAEDLAASTTARVIGINSIYANNYHKWVNEQGYIAGLGLDQVISLEPVTEGQAGAYYLKMVHAGEMGYFQTSGYTIGAKETAQVFVPIAASTSAPSTENTYYNGTDWDNTIGNSDATKLVRFVRGSAEGTDWLNPGSKTYANGKGPWTVFNVHALEFTTTEEQYIAVYEALKSAYEEMVINLPKDGGYYTIQSVSRGEGKFAYANPADNKMYWGGKTATSSEVVWKFEDNGDGTYTVSNMHTGTMMNTFINNDPSPLNPSSGSVTLKSLAPDGQIGIYSGNQMMMHAQGSGSGEIVHWVTGANDASAWRIVEADLSNVKYDLTISNYGLAGLHLNYPVKVPNDVNAYYVSMAEGYGGIAKLTKIENGIIPANEGVILEGTENATISLPYVSGDVAAISENLLKGSNYTGYIQGEDNTKYYLFGAKSGKVGLYWTYLQYNADGTINEANTDNGGYFKCSANKVYLPYSEGSGVAKFSFRFDDTTSIDDLLNGLNGEQLIYDLQGRRILKVTESGIYIVNGEKRYIHAK